MRPWGWDIQQWHNTINVLRQRRNQTELGLPPPQPPIPLHREKASSLDFPAYLRNTCLSFTPASLGHFVTEHKLTKTALTLTGGSPVSYMQVTMVRLHLEGLHLHVQLFRWHVVPSYQFSPEPHWVSTKLSGDSAPFFPYIRIKTG